VRRAERVERGGQVAPGGAGQPDGHRGPVTGHWEVWAAAAPSPTRVNRGLLIAGAHHLSAKQWAAARSDTGPMQSDQEIRAASKCQGMAPDAGWPSGPV